MSKAILILDMPNSCSECKMVYRKRNNKREVFRCQILKSNLQVDKIDNRCPLKPIPQKNKYDVEKYATVDYENNVNLGHYLNEGRNACIDEILGEKIDE